MHKGKIGVLLINLGTPESRDKKSVRRFLGEFLSDHRVIDLPWWVRKALVYLCILPFRTKQSLQAYSVIWDKEKGSPLLFHALSLSKEVQHALGEDYQVEIGMRYGQLNISQGLDKLMKAQCQKIIVFPLFPQYSSAASGSAIEKVFNSLSLKWNIPGLIVRESFYDDPLYIEAQAALIQPFLTDNQRVLFSYHSLPVRQIRKGGSSCASGCFREQPCQKITFSNQFCYRAQCYETSRLVATKLGLHEGSYEVAFQSRLGRTAWIGPDIQQQMPDLIRNGVQNLLVACPSFVADCLETLEEIGIRAQSQWVKLGGKHLTLVPCLNSHPLWVKAVVNYICHA